MVEKDLGRCWGCFSAWLNVIANNAMLRTAITRQSVMDLCQLINYTLAGQTQSSGICIYFVNSTNGTGIFPFTVQITDLIAKYPGNITISAMQFEAHSAVTVTSINNTCTQSTGINTSTSVITVNSTMTANLHTGHKVRVSSSTTLPNPLQASTDYWVIYLTATTIQLATSLANAQAGNYISLTTTGSGTMTIQWYSFESNMFQQATISTAVNLGNSDGQTAWQEFILPDQFVLGSTLSIVINGITWTQVTPTTLVNGTSTSTYYLLVPLNNNQWAIRFADGTYGLIPPNFPIYATYATGGGSASNISSYNAINSYAASNANITGVTNCTYFTGGGDQETLQTAKMIAPLLLSSSYRFVTIQDGVALILNYGGATRAVIVPNVYGPVSCQCAAIATGGGDISSALKTSLTTYLEGLSEMQAVNVVFVASTITYINISMNVHLLSGYNWAIVSGYITLACQLFNTETGQQIISAYLSNGIANAVSLINTIFSSNFGTSDYTTITNLLNNLTPRNYGDLIEQSVFDAYVQSNIAGISYFVITIWGPSGSVSNTLPIQLTSTQITTATGATISLTQI